MVESNDDAPKFCRLQLNTNTIWNIKLDGGGVGASPGPNVICLRGECADWIVGGGCII